MTQGCLEAPNSSDLNPVLLLHSSDISYSPAGLSLLTRLYLRSLGHVTRPRLHERLQVRLLETHVRQGVNQLRAAKELAATAERTIADAGGSAGVMPLAVPGFSFAGWDHAC